MTLTQNITLDVARETALHIAGKQFDENSRFLLVTIKEAGEEKSIPAGSTITLNARRPDGSAQSFAGSIQDGKAFVEIDQWILEQYGTVYCSISVVDSEAAKLTTLSFRLLVERAEGSGFVLVYVAAANLPAGTYYITMAGVNYSFTTTEAVPAGGKIYFSSIGTTGKTTNNGATIEDLTLTAGSTGTELQGSDIVNFLTQMQANVAAIDGELDSKADKSAIEENLAAGTSLATIDKDSYSTNTTPYLHRISPSGKRCEYDVIGGTVGWNQSVKNGNFADGTNEWSGSAATLSASDGILTVTKNENTGAGVGYARQFGSHLTLNHKYIYACDYKGIANKSLTLFTNSVNAGMTTFIPIDSNWHTVMIIVNVTTIPSVDCIFWLNYATTTGDNVAQFRNINFIDLTTLLGSTIADYAYTLEQATAGSGIAWLKSFGFLSKDYYEYCEPTLKSVEATARIATEADETEHTYPLGEITLRGIPKLDSNNNIYYDGDVYKASGEITRKYGIVDLGTLTWVFEGDIASGQFRAPRTDGNAVTKMKWQGYLVTTKYQLQKSASYNTLADGCISVTNSQDSQILRVRDSAYTDATAFKNSLSGVYLVYELATPTTESTSPYTPIQYTGSTEEFSTSNDVPVGVEGKYYTDLTLPTLPTANGTYALKCTVTDGTGIVSWVSE